jgi:hypothetical protein
VGDPWATWPVNQHPDQCSGDLVEQTKLEENVISEVGAHCRMEFGERKKNIPDVHIFPSMSSGECLRPKSLIQKELHCYTASSTFNVWLVGEVRPGSLGAVTQDKGDRSAEWLEGTAVKSRWKVSTPGKKNVDEIEAPGCKPQHWRS